MSLKRKHFDISLDITSPTLTLDEMQHAFGVLGDPGSRSRGDLLPGERTASLSVLRVNSGLDEETSLIDQLEAIRRRVLPDHLQGSEMPVKVTLTIAVYFATANASVLLDRALLELVMDYGCEVEVIAYPTND